MDKRIPYTKKISVYGTEQEEPVFWNDYYIREHERLIQELGKYVSKHPDVDFVDLGGMGEWGEMHLQNWSPSELEQFGFTPEIYLNTILKMMDHMNKYLPLTVKVLNVAPLENWMEPVFKIIVDKAVRNGWWIRTDGYSEQGPPSYVKPYLEKYYMQTGFIIEPAGGINKNYFNQPIPVNDYFRAVLEYHPTIVNLMGLWDLDKLNQKEIGDCIVFAKKVGYRFQIEQVSMPKAISKNTGSELLLPIKISISQNGSSYFFSSAYIEIKFVQDGKIVYKQALFPATSLSQLGPNEKKHELFIIKIPAQIPVNDTKIYLAIKDTKYGYLNLDNKDMNEDKFLYVGSLYFSDGNNKSSSQFELTKDNYKTALSPFSGIKIEKSENGFKINGTEKNNNWAYVNTHEVKIKPNHVYIMKVRLRAWKTEIKDSKIGFEFIVFNKKWKWIKSINIGTYDLLKEGTWQDFNAYYLPQTSEEEILLYSIAKGKSTPSSINAEIASWSVEEILVP